MNAKDIVENNPMNSVPKLLKEIHFNPEHNENHNIYIPNKKQHKKELSAHIERFFLYMYI